MPFFRVTLLRRSIAERVRAPRSPNPFEPVHIPMPQFDPEGRRIFERLEAESEEAVRRFHAEGVRDRLPEVLGYVIETIERVE